MFHKKIRKIKTLHSREYNCFFMHTRPHPDKQQKNITYYKTAFYIEKNLFYIYFCMILTDQLYCFQLLCFSEKHKQHSPPLPLFAKATDYPEQLSILLYNFSFSLFEEHRMICFYHFMSSCASYKKGITLRCHECTEPCR
jgi:hypothetical protein